MSYTYGIKDSAIPFLKNQDLNNSIVIGLLSLITLYLLITYILSYAHDVFALYQTKNCLVYESFRYPMEYSGEALIRASKAESTDKEKAHVEQVITILDSCRTAYRKVLLATAGNYLNKFFGTFLWDLVLPCGLSIFILSKANSEMWAVVNSIISKVL